jgi:hypothetical protein
MNRLLHYPSQGLQRPLGCKWSGKTVLTAIQEPQANAVRVPSLAPIGAFTPDSGFIHSSTPVYPDAIKP